ncbi:MBL fold metallo-hydrolase [Actinosynnema sp. NPDC047251]|uniref:Metal-dependent hydrolase of the beta-lactamase superfamily III n=1 Tax=Saccharothrix espanaensis (strain ATCC 51144 / DSM 44229 / JCM 9112 / NBRC 15066 / NRRL 15764) TaxID=1179773 RepID=K0K1M9_SACES|nr:MBL fold metallo-hydrolase [Saccharothrix espanaensis]CCH31477.1 Metal-dependent hydrolase of the beta-lactamase superfamily III [Saccharothrix espanaensis DSM 44229]
MTFTLTALGTATPYPRPDRACSGYLLSTPTTRVWVDAGPGSLANLQRHTTPDRLDAVWISHTHADHTADLLPTYYALLHADLTPTRPLPLYGPPGLAHRLETFLASTGPNPAHAAFEVHELHDGHRADVGDLTLTSHAVQHGLPAFGLRATHGDRTLAYSGDTGPCPALHALAAGADLLLCEADGTDPSPVHCTPEDAADAARSAGRLLITHIGHTLTEAQATERAGAPAAHDHETHQVG